MKAINIEGQKFGFLTALNPIISNKKTNGRSYRCICDCGKEVIRKVSALRAGGNRQSCGCKYSFYYEKEFDLTGQKFGFLLIKKRMGSHKSSKSVLYLCECDCGNKIEITSKALQRRKTISCGCKGNPGKALPGDQGIFNKLVSNYKSNAKKRQLPFALTNQQCRLLFSDNCFYCNIAPNKIFTHKKYKGEFIYNGIDRLNNSVGYIFDNVVSCCMMCNYKKRETDVSPFLEWIEKVYKNRIVNKSERSKQTNIVY